MSEISLVLKGLNCPNCAGKIEKGVGRLISVRQASINLMKQEIVVEYDGINKDELIKAVAKITNDLEPGVVVMEKSRKTVVRQRELESHAHSHEAHSHEAHSHEAHNHDGCCCGGHEHEHDSLSHEAPVMKREGKKVHTFLDGELKKRVLLYALGFVLFLLAKVLEDTSVYSLPLYLSSYLIFGGPVVKKAVKNILRGEIFDENFLMGIATIGAIAIGEYTEGVAVMIFYQIGEFFQDMAVGRSRKSIQDLMDLKPEYANLETEGQVVRVDPVDVNVGDIILVKPGEKVPLDGVVAEGKSQVDMSGLTGEPAPQTIIAGENIQSGSVNLTGAIKIRTTKIYDDSTVAKIMELVENATSKKAPTEKFITKFSKVYTPIVVGAALLIAFAPPMLYGFHTFSQWLYRGLIFLIVSCPCALVLSVPLSFFSGIGGASRRGVLIKGSAYLEALAKVDTVVFDKTGTLTKGVFTVTKLCPAEGVSHEELLRDAYVIERLSNHPIAKSVVKEFEKSYREAGLEEVTSFEEIPGHGIKGIFRGETISAGNARLMEKEGVVWEEYSGFGTVLHVSNGGQYKGYIIISDIVREDSKQAISSLNNIGIKNTYMLTGDKKQNAEIIGGDLGVSHVLAELLPGDKVNALENIYIQSPKAKVAFAGDGINDAPVLARADVGIAMGGIGSDAAIEAADIVIMTDEPSKIADAIKISRKTMAIVKQNITLAISIKFLVQILSVFGLATMWLAVFADVGVALLAVLNAVRAKTR